MFRLPNGTYVKNEKYKLYSIFSKQCMLMFNDHYVWNIFKREMNSVYGTEISTLFKSQK